MIHIVPQLPPQNSGVGDYATLVGRRMEEVEGGVVCGYVAAGQEAVELPADGPRVRNVTGRSEGAALWRGVGELREQQSGRAVEQEKSSGIEQQSVSVVLHYSGYGFERNGCPAWLVDALRNRPAWVGRVVTYFHELYATGRPWQRAFWYSSRQRRTAIEIARLSDVILTNLESSARWLEQVTGQRVGGIVNLPVPSNVGEPNGLPNLESRPRRAVTFGNERWKRFALADDAKSVATFLQRLGITELVDIGAPSPVDRQRFERAGISVRQMGYLSASDASRELLQCRVGFLEYPISVAAKSGVFAAYAAHGVVPIFRKGDGDQSDELQRGFHYSWLSVADRVDSAELPAASINIADWYRRHDIAHHAATLHAECTNATSSMASAL